MTTRSNDMEREKSDKELAETKAALAVAQAELLRLDELASFGRVAPGVAHEAKNLLTAIVGFVQVLGRKLEDPNKARELLDRIEEQTGRCRDLLLSLLNLARGPGLELELQDINLVVQKAVRVFEHTLNLNKVKVEVELGEVVPKAFVDLKKLQQVLLNLALNAQQAMPEGGLLRLKTRAEGTGVAIIVSDTGSGVPPALRKEIFEPFFTTKRAGEGTGLGLAVSLELVREQGGSMHLDETEKEGASFTILLRGADND